MNAKALTPTTQKTKKSRRLLFHFTADYNKTIHLYLYEFVSIKLMNVLVQCLGSKDKIFLMMSAATACAWTSGDIWRCQSQEKGNNNNNRPNNNNNSNPCCAKLMCERGIVGLRKESACMQQSVRTLKLFLSAGFPQVLESWKSPGI